MHVERLIGVVAEKTQGWVRQNWHRMLAAHHDNCPGLCEFFPGSFNARLTTPENWRPPNEGFFYGRSRDRGLEMWKRLPEEEWKARGGDFLACGNFIHPQIRVRSINGKEIDGILYFPGMGLERWDSRQSPWPLSRRHGTIEIIARQQIRPLLGIAADTVGTAVEVELVVDCC